MKAGLNQWNPRKRSLRAIALFRSEIAKPDVFDAKIASFFTTRVQLCEDALLEVEVLRHRLDDEVAVAQVTDLLREGEARGRRVELRLRHLAALDRTLQPEAAFDHRLPRLFDEVVVEVADDRLEAVRRERLRDAAAHHAAAHHADQLDVIDVHDVALRIAAAFDMGIVGEAGSVCPTGSSQQTANGNQSNLIVQSP